MPFDKKTIVNSSEVMRKSLNDLKGIWGTAIAGFVLYFVIIIVISFIPFASFVIGGAFALGLSIFSLNIARNKGARIEDIFEGFKNFGNAFLTYLLMVVFIVLWSLLFIIPGIIAAYSYSQAFFIMAEDNQISGMDAINKSKEMMDGYKTEYFMMSLKFLGLTFLSIFTLGIAFLWLFPFMYVSMANFYRELKGTEDELSLEDNLIA